MCISYFNLFIFCCCFCLFRIVYDRETGKPKGYGFCEYQDLETAQSAMRNLNDHDFHGRNLRVGPAAGETSNAEKGRVMTVHMIMRYEPLIVVGSHDALKKHMNTFF